MRGYILSVLVCVLNAQIAPHWGTITCDSSLTDRYPQGQKYTSSGTTDYFRYYTFTADYPTSLRRNVKISTCIEDKPSTMNARLENNGRIRWSMDPQSEWEDDDDESSCEGDDEQGRTYTFNDLPEGDWEIGVYNPFGSPYDGGKYKLSVECVEPPKPTADQLKSNNVTQTFNYKGTWSTRGSKTISCGANAFDEILIGDQDDWYQLEITEYAQELMFTTCSPETAYNDYYSGSAEHYNTQNPNFLNSQHRIEFYYWDFGTNGNRQWRQQNSVYTNGNPYRECANLVVGSAYSYDPAQNSNLLMLSPGTYYVRVYRTFTNTDRSYVLSMQCWNNDAVKNAIAGTNYGAATFNPTPSPNTASPSIAAPTSNTTTYSPTSTPTVTFDGVRDKVRKTMNMGEIACGVHQHDQLVRKENNYYVFELKQSTYVYFDTCMNDITQFDACVRLYYYSPSNDDFLDYNNWASNVDCGYCNLMKGTLPANVYYIEIYGTDSREEAGDYILRMGCGYGQQDNSVPVSATDAPTPAPTGIADIPARDGRVVGDISCGITLQGTTSSERGDFHKFTVIGGGIDWVKFDTCDATSFKNYLFVYNYFNLTGLEMWEHESYNSVGFHYEDDTTCNEIVMNDLVPGVYYVNIDGFNYYFDHGEYTIKMSCSDNSAIKGASKYEEYSTGLEWWAILLIVLACLLCCGCIIFGVCFWKKKQGGDGFGSTGSGGNTEMGKTDDAGE